MAPMAKRVALLDYGSGNIRSAHRALERVGAEVEVTHDPQVVLAADGLLVPGVGAYAACMQGLKSVKGDRMIGERLAGSRPVFGICVGMQIMFEQGVEHGTVAQGCGQWPGVVEKLTTEVVPVMGWNTVEAPEGSQMFASLEPSERFYFVHSYGVMDWTFKDDGLTTSPLVTWTQQDACRYVAAVENGPLWAAQFHPEKSGDAGAQLLKNWLDTL